MKKKTITNSDYYLARFFSAFISKKYFRSSSGQSRIQVLEQWIQPDLTSVRNRTFARFRKTIANYEMKKTNFAKISYQNFASHPSWGSRQSSLMSISFGTHHAPFPDVTWHADCICPDLHAPSLCLVRSTQPNSASTVYVHTCTYILGYYFCSKCLALIELIDY